MSDEAAIRALVRDTSNGLEDPRRNSATDLVVRGTLLATTAGEFADEFADLLADLVLSSQLRLASVGQNCYDGSHGTDPQDRASDDGSEAH